MFVFIVILLNDVSFSLFFTEKMAFVNQLWVSCLFFCGGITVGKIGRQLAMLEYVPSTVKLHAD